MELHEAGCMYNNIMSGIIKLGFDGLMDKGFDKQLRCVCDDVYCDIVKDSISYGFLNLGLWRFGFNRSKTIHGSCYYHRKEIRLSKYLTEINDEDEIRNTILHEISHAILPPSFGHNKVWKMLFIYLGGDGRVIASERAKFLNGKYIYSCPNCGYEYHRFKVITKLNYYCVDCFKTYKERYILKLKEENNLVIK